MQVLHLDKSTTALQVVDGNNFLINRMQATSNGLIIRETLTEITACVQTPIFVFDPLDGNDRRRKLYPAYKVRRQQRAQQNDNRFIVYEALDRFRALLGMVNCVMIRTPGWEADDVIATIARSEAKSGRPVRVVTTDKDLSQLASERIEVTSAIEGMSPDDVRLFKTLAGDTSDNITGIPGFGPRSWAHVNKEAMRWMLEDGQWNAQSDNRSLGLTPGQYRWCSENFDQLLVFWDIVDLYTVPADEIVSSMSVGTAQPQALEQILRKHML